MMINSVKKTMDLNDKRSKKLLTRNKKNEHCMTGWKGCMSKL